MNYREKVKDIKQKQDCVSQFSYLDVIFPYYSIILRYLTNSGLLKRNSSPRTSNCSSLSKKETLHIEAPS
jgi:hypothetical protein